MPQKMSANIWLAMAIIIYFIAGMIDVYFYDFAYLFYIQLVWLFVMSLPLWVTPIARWCNMVLPYGKK